MIRELTREIFDKAPYIWLPTPYVFTAWWPWVKNYGGESRAGAVRPGPIYARVWVDRDSGRRWVTEWQSVRAPASSGAFCLARAALAC